jgi:regulator of replication initiation timing
MSKPKPEDLEALKQEIEDLKRHNRKLTLANELLRMNIEDMERELAKEDK